MYPLDRTHRLRDDLDWLPGELKLLRWSVSGACGVAASGLAAAAIVASGGLLAHLAVIGAAGGFYGGARLGQTIMRRRLDRLARGGLDLSRLGREAEGELVHVSGRVSAEQTLPSFLHGAPAVYRRMTFRFDGTRYIHEAAVDFDLVDEAGARLRVHVDDARLLAPAPRELLDYPATLFTARAMPPSLARIASSGGAFSNRTTGAVASAEIALAPSGDTIVDVIGYKTEVIDPVAGTRDGRGPPVRAALRSGRIPVIIAPRTPLQPPDAW